MTLLISTIGKTVKDAKVFLCISPVLFFLTYVPISDLSGQLKTQSS